MSILFGKSLKNEYERLTWLAGKLPVPNILGFTQIDERDVLFLSEVPGLSLAVLCKQWPVEKVLSKFAKELHQFHDTDISSCPFGSSITGKTLVHGDATLPHFIFGGDEFSGCVDLGEVQIGNPEMDLSAAVWSLQYNLGPGHGLNFLREYGVKDPSEEYVEWLRMRYDDVEQAWEF